MTLWRAAAAVTAFLLCACQRTPSSEERAGARPAASSPPSATISANSPAAKPATWYEGRWSGTYEAVLERITLEAGGVRAWKDDDGQRASGKGTLAIAVNADGVASGEAEGPLGTQLVHGVADDQGLRLTLAPKSAEPSGFRGTLVAPRGADTLTGALRASSGDSLTVRHAKVDLTRSAP